MRSPKQAGVGGTLPFLAPTSIVGAFIVLKNAVSRPGGRFGDEVVFTAELCQDAFDENGEALPFLFKFSQKANEPRMEYVSAFAADREPIGPFIVAQLPPQFDGESGPVVLNDASDMIEIAALPNRPAVTTSGPGALVRAREAVTARNGSTARPAGPSASTATTVPPSTFEYDDLGAPPEVGTRMKSQRYGGVWYVKTSMKNEWMRADLWEQQSFAPATADNGPLEDLPF